MKNPFNVTKAVHFTDEEINRYWVDFSQPGEQGSFLENIIKPQSGMPLFIFGGKGSGKTHIIRYHSYALQKTRFEGNKIINGLQRDGYIGICAISSGLNGGRFSGKGYSGSDWRSVFEYSMEIWLSLLLLSIFCEISEVNELGLEQEKSICKNIVNLFDKYDGEQLSTIGQVYNYIETIRKRVDWAVNNCSFLGSLKEISIDFTRGKLIYGIPEILRNMIGELANVQFLYLIDELENYSGEQQRFINALVRDRKPPCSFRIGARLYGLKTRSTYSDEEKNIEGSEYEKIVLDQLLRENKKRYSVFAKRMIVRRLSEDKLFNQFQRDDGGIIDDELSVDNLEFLFERYAPSDYETGSIDSKNIFDIPSKKRKYFEKLSKELHKIGSPSGDVSKIVASLSCQKYPLLEKLNIFMLYKSFKNPGELVSEAANIAKACKAFQNGKKSGPYALTYGHFKSDLLAQLRKDCFEKQKYLGIDSFINMSEGLPKNILIILKNVYQWASYYGEEIFNQPFSIQSQQKGVFKSSDWFYNDCATIWTDGKQTQDSIARLCKLYKNIRFSDKPSECSLITFSYDSNKITDESKKIIKYATQWSLLINSGVQRSKNSKENLGKIQLNSLLSPRWDLAISRRGTISLSPDEINSIFDKKYENEFDEYFKVRISRMTAPYFSSKNVEKRQLLSNKKNSQTTIFQLDAGDE